MPPQANLLADETSPYLLQHKDNPVHWRPWGAAALNEAQETGKPVLLSVGYAACHWCHVMAHESFENPEIAALMNENFINIKVDREERPDIDGIYQNALALMGEHGGWPLTMFLTPDGQPFWGGTYFPPEDRWGRPGFRQVLTRLSEAYHAEPEKVEKNVTALQEALENITVNRSGAWIDLELLNRIAERLHGEIDPQHGGIGSAPKFPQPGIMALLLRAWRRTGRQDFLDGVTQSVRPMLQGGIYDHLGGGLARYSTDVRWLVPHFEKMLYDNAQLLPLLAHLWRETGDPLYRTRAEETVGWLLHEMRTENGAFAASQDADSEGVEGKYYVWTEAEIDAVLGDDADLFKSFYDVTPGGNWEGVTILNRLQAPDLADPATEERLAALRRRLLAVREQRVRPGWDDKVLADWNGLMIEGLALAGFILAIPEWIAAANHAFDAIRRDMGDGDRLWHSYRSGRAQHAGMLEDYSNLARAGLALYEVTGDADLLAQVEGWVAVLDAHFWDPEGGGYFMTADDGERLILRSKTVADSATPAGNGSMVHVLARLFYLTGNSHYQDRATALIQAFAGEVERNFFPLATYLNGVELMQDAVALVLCGDPATKEAKSLLEVIRERFVPTQVLQLLPANPDLPAGHAAHGKTAQNSCPTVYICRGQRCSPPVTDAAKLQAVLAAEMA